MVLIFLLFYSKTHANLLYCVVRGDGDCSHEVHSLECTGGSTNKLSVDCSISTRGKRRPRPWLTVVCMQL